MQDFEALFPGQYPIFKGYPAYIVDYQVKERERIRQQELQYLREKAALLAGQREAVILAKQEQEWSRRQDELLDAEEKRREW